VLAGAEDCNPNSNIDAASDGTIMATAIITPTVMLLGGL
jgi:hypothetical protein